MKLFIRDDNGDEIFEFDNVHGVGNYPVDSDERKAVFRILGDAHIALLHTREPRKSTTR